jgi:ABC-2 type transport system permease protein
VLNTLHRIWGLALKELLQLSRDKLLLGFVFLGTLVELLLVGGLKAKGVENLPLAVVDLDRSRASRELIVRLDQSDELLIKEYGESLAEAQQWMQSGRVSVIVMVPPGYGETLTDPLQSATVQVIADGSHNAVSTVAIATTESVAAEIAQDLTARYAIASSGPVELRFVARFNALLDDRPYVITAMLALIVYEVTLIIAAQSFARERELGTLEQLRVTPLGRLELILGKGIPPLLVGLVDCLLMTGAIMIWFDIPMRGSLLLLLGLTVPFILVQVGWGTLISLVSRTQQQALLFVFALAILEIALSGFMVPAGDMPGPARILSTVSSMRYHLTIVRGVMLRGAGLESLWLPGLALGGIAFAVMGLAWLRLSLGLDTDSSRQWLRNLWHICQRRRHERRERRSERRTKKPPSCGKRKRGLPQKPAYAEAIVEAGD